MLIRHHMLKHSWERTGLTDSSTSGYVADIRSVFHWLSHRWRQKLYLRFLLQVLEIPSYRGCLLTSHHKGEWIPALHIHPWIKVAIADFLKSKNEHLHCSASHTCNLLPSPSKTRKASISGSHLPVFHWFLPSCTIASSFHGRLQIRYILCLKNPHASILNFSFYKLKKIWASSVSWWKAINLFNSMKQHWFTP